MKSLLTVFFLVFTYSGFSQTEDDTLNELIEWMTGSFSSEEQASKNEDYYDINLHMVPIWEDISTDEAYLYVEQASVETPDQPYRQRVYYIYKVDEDMYASEVYTLPEAEKYIGAYKQEKPLDDLKPGNLTERKGCTVYLEYDGFASFSGSTEGKNCESTLRGASYATSEVSVMDGSIISWDQGFDAYDLQVWGATRGGYIFIRSE